MNRELRAITVAMLAFALTLLLSHNLTWAVAALFIIAVPYLIFRRINRA